MHPNQNKEELYKIAIIICYSGKLPWYFSLFIHSCKFNPTVNFFIITDNVSIRYPIPDNVSIQFKSLTEISTIASKRLNFSVDIKSPYKLCDFKPAYGYIFSELIEGYDFWGWGDIDVIYGNIRNFITDELLDNYDILSVRHDFLNGYFQILKNNDKMITLFTNSKDYRKVFTSDINYCFDETNFEHKAFSDEMPYYLVKSEIESMTHVVRKMEASKIIRPYFDFHVIEGLPGKLKWSNGILYYKNKYEVILYHLIKLKYVYRSKDTADFDFGEFRISPTKIYSRKK